MVAFASSGSCGVVGKADVAGGLMVAFAGSGSCGVVGKADVAAG